MKNKISTILVISCLVGFCVIAVLQNVFSIGQLPSSFMGAALGALITVSVTTILLEKQSETQKELLIKQSETQKELLEKQSDEEEVKEKNVKVFEMKSILFQEYIDKLWKIWSVHEITSGEYEKLVGMYYSNLLIYLKEKKSVDKIGECLVKMGKFIDEKTYGERYNILALHTFWGRFLGPKKPHFQRNMGQALSGKRQGICYPPYVSCLSS